ncbi:MAG TPA: HlyD family efflux transporter periplasmic adaptor subunit [Cyclobacteriaceae bacterium]|nr:HlyD family efflux transporter periplasmic adaptor subunit [Cyclobacteriaceae bacterium]
MDKQLKKKRFTVKKVATWGGGALLIIFIGYQFLFADRRTRLKVDQNKITISEVKRGVFQETIPQTGEVRPKNTVYLDVLEGGNIKRILKESGAMLKAGDVIMELSNFNRELSVLTQEAAFNESINRARETQVSLTRMDTEQRLGLAQIQQQLDILGPQYERARALYEKKLISKQDYEIAESSYRLNKESYRIRYEAYKTDSADRIRSLASTRLSEQKMIKSLDGVGQILENLAIKTPIDGQLSFLQHWDVGQAVNTGQRLGQVDVMGSYKVRVPIDELYLPRIQTGLHATTELAGKSYGLVITYKYPDVVAGRFEVDMDFEGEVPESIRRGMSLRLRIELGMSSEELLLPVGGFYKDTGGNWVFVLDNNNQAVKRDIKLGRKSPDYFEVLEGLQPGDKVITSSYENFGNNEVLILN